MKLKSAPKDALTYEQLRDDYLFCRTVGHGWEEIVADWLPKPESGYRLSLECFRCHTQRHQIVDATNGDSFSRKYDYPEGYQLDEKATRSEMRLEWGLRHKHIKKDKK